MLTKIIDSVRRMRYEISAHQFPNHDACASVTVSILSRRAMAKSRFYRAEAVDVVGPIDFRAGRGRGCRSTWGTGSTAAQVAALGEENRSRGATRKLSVTTSRTPFFEEPL
jgi:hypothetical protein